MKDIAIALTAAAAVAGCSAGSSTLAPAFAPPSALTAARALRVAPDSNGGTFLYVTTTGSGTVLGFTWPGLYAAQTISGLDVPEALCTDASGDLYVPDLLAKAIYEYAPGGTTPINTLTDSHGFAYSCSVDPKTGNLAVADAVSSESGTAGNVLLFEKANGTPILYAAPNLKHYYYVAFDGSGNLFVNGIGSKQRAGLAELAKGASRFAAISVKTAIGRPAGLQWDGLYLAEGDDDSNVIYQFAVSNGKAIEKGSTTLAGAGSIYQFCITGSTKSHRQGTQVIVADSANNSVEVWSYPSAGVITSGISELNGPIGVAIGR